jgi:aspartyl-tRNA(Asn)/glutamyl-tRNA(Gln) amidotransferase subunit B
MVDWEAVIGLEVHAQLDTRSKIFCACATDAGAPPNARTCPVCLGHPGALPVLNRGAVRLAVRAAKALGCEVARTSVFARKNYFYPDLPKGYQISQYEQPLATGGGVAIEPSSGPRLIRLIRLHLEEDAGKLVHEGLPSSGSASHVDLNRAGTPLAEIVSEPDLRTPEEAYLYLQRLRAILRWAGVCDGNLEQGSLRCDANVSVRPRGTATLGVRTELKNLNSFRNVQRAIEYEITRQVGVLESGGTLTQGTALWDADAGVSRPMRGKEEAQDYRYFPEPDLPPLLVDAATEEEAARELPELPAERKARFIERFGLSPDDAHALTLERPVADFFEAAASASGDARSASNFAIHDLARVQNASKLPPDAVPVSAPDLAVLIGLVHAGTISTTAARTVFDAMAATGKGPEVLVRELGLAQVSDEAALRKLLEETVAAFPAEWARLKEGKTQLLEFFVGKVMRASRGSANPAVVRALVEEELAR